MERENSFFLINTLNWRISILIKANEKDWLQFETPDSKVTENGKYID